jgi:glycosyltransferase involved in cell wall biosynthesis
MSRHPLRVTIASANPFGGAGVHSAALADYLANRGDEVQFVFAASERGLGRDECHLPSHPAVRVLPRVGGGTTIARSRRVGWAVRHTQPDATYLSKGNPHEATLLGVLGCAVAAPLVIFEHDAPPDPYAPRWRRWGPPRWAHDGGARMLLRGQHRLAARVVTNSESTREKQRRFYGGRVDEIVPLGVDLTRFSRTAPLLPRRSGACRIGLVGRADVPMKGLDLAFAAIGALPAALQAKLELVMPVAPPNRPTIAALADSVGATPWLTLIELVAPADLPALYASFDVLLVASRFEGGPYTMLEAMACGTPVIATPVGLVPNVIEDGVNGIRVSATDSVPALVEGIERFLALSPEARAELGGRAREIIVRNHDAEHHFARLRAILHEVAGR